MADRNPIYAEEDDLGNVTNLAEFVTGDEIPSQYLGPASSVTGWTLNTNTNTITNLGTVATVAITGGAVKTIGRTIHFANNLSGGPGADALLDGPVSSLSGLNVSGPFHAIETNLGNTAIAGTLSIQPSSLTVSTCPVPAPFGYIQLTADDVASSDEKHVGYSNTPTYYESDSSQIKWDDSAKNFIVKFAGTYEVVARVFFEGGSTLVEMHVNKEGTPVNTANPRAHTTVDPVERTISAIFTAAVDDVIDVTYEATSAQTTAAQIGTTVTIKRLI